MPSVLVEGPDAGQLAQGAKQEDQGAEGEVGIAINLLHVPDAGEGGDDQSGQIEQRKVERGVPGEGVADAAVEGIRPILVEAQNVGAGLGAGQLSAQAGDAGADKHRASHAEFARLKPWAKSEKVSGPGVRKNTQIQMGQWAAVADAVGPGTPRAMSEPVIVDRNSEIRTVPRMANPRLAP